MADPVALANLADLLKIESVTWDVQRNDELSGGGDARTWQAELADPLWTAEATLVPAYLNEAKQIAARIRRLRGAQDTFLLYDPMSLYPQADPDGSTLGSSTVTVLDPAVGDNRSLIRLQGLPAGYVLTIGDKLQITYNSATRYAFLEVTATTTADGTGNTPAAGMEVFPHVPAGVLAGNAVTLIKPAAKVFVVPGSFHPGTGSGGITRGARFTAMQRP